MSKYYEGLTDPTRVRDVYSTPSNLDAKYEVMREYGIAGATLEEWLLRRLDLPPDSRVLDVGCGQGRFLLPIARGAQRGFVVGCDIAPGVLSELARTLVRDQLPAIVLIADAQALPFLDASFDVVMANHMLYHVEDIALAVGEGARVLGSGGVFVATTNGRGGMTEMHDLHVATMSELGIPYVAHEEHGFDLEGGAMFLKASFPEIEVWRFEDGFRSPSADAVTKYYMATQLFQGPVNDAALDEAQRRAIESTYRRLAEEKIRALGSDLVVSKPVGAFVARKP